MTVLEAGGPPGAGGPRTKNDSEEKKRCLEAGGPPEAGGPLEEPKHGFCSCFAVSLGLARVSL